jgi:hypothetical protein
MELEWRALRSQFAFGDFSVLTWFKGAFCMSTPVLEHIDFVAHRPGSPMGVGGVSMERWAEVFKDWGILVV